MDVEFAFDFDGRKLTSRPVDRDGMPLKAGNSRVGPRLGGPYVLAAGDQDIFCESPALTDTSPPEIRQGVTRKVQLSKILKEREAVRRVLVPI